jgi:hypothetical protein
VAGATGLPFFLSVANGTADDTHHMKKEALAELNAAARALRLVRIA